MSTVEKSIRLYAWKTNYQTFRVVQGEDDSRKFNIQLFGTTIPIDLTNCSVKFFAVKPDQTKVYVNCDVIDADDGLVSLSLDNQMCAVEGIVDCWVQVIGNGGTDLRFEGLSLEVSACDLEGAIEETESTNDMKAFLQQSAKLAAIESELADIRVGYNNTVYESAGEAVRTQIGELKTGESGGGGTSLTWVMIDKDTELSEISFNENSVYYFAKGNYSVGTIHLSNIANVTFLMHEATINILNENFIDAVGCDDIKIFGGILSGSSTTPIKLTNCKRPDIGGVIVQNVGSVSAEDTAGIRLLGDCTGFNIHDCYIHDITSGVISSDGFIHAYGVQINRLASTNAYSKTGVIEKCCIEDIAGIDSGDTKADGDGIFINNPPYLDDSGNVIWRDDINIKVDKCTINGCKKRGIKITSVGVKVKDTYVDGEMWYAGIDCQYGHADIDGCTVINKSDYNNSVTSAIVACEGGVRVRRSTIKAPYKDTYHPGIRFNKRLPASVVPNTTPWDDILIEDCYFDKVSRSVYGYVSDTTDPVPAKGIHIKNCRIGDFNQAHAVELSNTMFSSIESFELSDFRFDYGSNRDEVKEKNANFVYPIGIGLNPTIAFDLYSNHWTNEPMSGYDGLPSCPHAKIIYAGSGMGNIYYKEYTGHGSRLYGNRAPDTITSTLSKQLLYNSKVGDMYTDTTAGKVYICTVAGTSSTIGTWTDISTN